MNIEELFENEKWAGYGMVVTDDANQAIDYLKEEVMEYVAGLRQRIAELEFDKANLVDRIIGLEIHKTGVIGQGNRIAELEAQLKNAKEHASAAASWLQRGWISKAAEEIEKIGGDV